MRRWHQGYSRDQRGHCCNKHGNNNIVSQSLVPSGCPHSHLASLLTTLRPALDAIMEGDGRGVISEGEGNYLQKIWFKAASAFILSIILAIFGLTSW
jgi:hypothetical protein